VEVYEQEREHVWWGDGSASGGRGRAQPGRLPGPQPGRESILIPHDRGELRGFYNVCSHRGTRFVDGPGGSARKVFACPYHSWSYAPDGCLVGSPNVKESEDFERANYPLPRSPSRPTRASFREPGRAAAAAARAADVGARDESRRSSASRWTTRVGVRIQYDVAANWKILVENYNECLHCPTIHPELVKVVPLFRFGEVWDEQIPTTATGWWRARPASR